MKVLLANWRLVAVVSLIAASAVFLDAHRRTEVIPKAEALSAFPLHMGDWSGREVPIDEETRSVLGPGNFLSRSYMQASQPPVGLFIAYFPSQRTGDTIHSPKNCLPGAGWTFLQSGTTEIDAGRHRLRVGKYVIAKSMDRELVLYWYQAHGRAITSEYWAKIYLVADSIRMNRSDGSLIRVITPMLPGESERAAELRAAGFVAQMIPTVSRFIPD